MKVVSNRKKERDLARLSHELDDITSKFIPKGEETRVIQGNFLVIGDFQGIIVLPKHRMVRVYDQGHYEVALKLTGAYADHTNKRWILKRVYD